MKRTVIVLWCWLLLIGCMGCGVAVPESSDADSDISSSETTAESQSSQGVNEVLSTADDDPVIGSEITISEQEQEQLISDISQSMKNGLWVILRCWYGMDIDETAEPVVRYYNEQEYPYYPLVEFATKDELLTRVLTYFSQDVVDGLLLPLMDQGDKVEKYPFTEQPVFIEENGRLYASPEPSGGGGISFFADSIQIIEADKDSGYISATELPTGEMVDGKPPAGETLETTYLRVVYERGRWVLDSFLHYNYWEDDPFGSKHRTKLYGDSRPFLVNN